MYQPGFDKECTPIIEISRKFSVGRKRAYFVDRRQFPLRLAAAKTIHKSQGSTMDDGVLHFGKRKIDHIHYVGLSRIKKLTNVKILELNAEKIKVSQDVQNEMDRLRKESVLSFSLTHLMQDSSLCQIVFHNTRSLHAHYEDFKQAHNKKVFVGDIIVLAESRLSVCDSDSDYALPGYTLYRFNEISTCNQRSHKSIAMYSKLKIDTVTNKQILDTNVIFVKLLISNQLLQAAFFYISPSQASLTYLKNFLRYVLSQTESMVPLILMGDTNVDFDKSSTMSNFLDTLSLRQIITGATSDYGSCIDHVYIQNMANRFNVKGYTSESYYSDHKPIIAQLS